MGRSGTIPLRIRQMKDIGVIPSRFCHSGHDSKGRDRFSPAWSPCYLCLILGTEVWVRQPGGHVQHEGLVEFAHFVRDVDVHAASLDHDLKGEMKHPVGERRGCLRNAIDTSLSNPPDPTLMVPSW